jgi:DNA polymerase-1
MSISEAGDMSTIGAEGKAGQGTLFLIDGSSVIYRAFHAIPSTLTGPDGAATNAVYGFTQTLWKILRECAPTHIGVAFDVKGPSFRHAVYDEYKAERPPMPDNLISQIPLIKDVVRAFNIPVLEKESFEADDVIATVAGKAASSGLRVAIISGDKDLLQLVGGATVVFDYLSGREVGPKEVEEKFGVGPGRIVDLLGLAGDSSDNIPGVPGIGLKTAQRLLADFGSIDGLYERIDEVSGARLREGLREHKGLAYMSRGLATLHADVPLDLTIEGLRRSAPDMVRIEPLFARLGFKKLLKEIFAANRPKEPLRPGHAVARDGNALESLLMAAREARSASLAVFFDGEGVGASLIGASVATGAALAWYLPVGGDGLAEEAVQQGLRRLLEDNDIVKNTDDSKALHLYFGRLGVEPRGLGVDTSIASYLINPSRSDHGVQALSAEFLGRYFEDRDIRGLDPVEAAALACVKACNIAELSGILLERLEKDGLLPLYYDMELPLSAVLAGMESAGIKVDGALLRALSKEIERDLSALELKVYAAAGVTFNINSPKQLSEVLFQRLGMKPVKKTRTGYSTDEETLTRLASGHEVAAHVLSYRQLSKVKSTYVDALIETINPATGRVHTSFNQTVTATGRLSSSRPNLQNIPVKGEPALRVREAFVADEGYTLLSADYSQIELRIVAHMSGDPLLMEAFDTGLDIHARTASEIFGVPEGLVTPEMRRRAKAINFGIIYGMGAYGLSTELGIPVTEAEGYIESYFEHYGGVRLFIEKTVEDAARSGFTTTLFGRRRYVPELANPSEQTRRLGARIAINTPVQGSAADIIKAAMVRISGLLKDGGFSSRMILQIHDELVLEASVDEFAEVSSLVKREMEGVIRLLVPVVVNLKSGANWRLAV